MESEDDSEDVAESVNENMSNEDEDDSEDVVESVNGNTSNEDEESDDEVVGKHRQDLKNLEKIDPEFHKFLQENDKGLLDFDSSASEDEDAAENEQLHEPPESLEVCSRPAWCYLAVRILNVNYFWKVASDASDYEDDSAAEVTGKITQQIVATWEKELDGNK